MNFDKAFEKLLGHEGGYSNNPADPGGETMWGVTIAVARASGYSGSMRNMPVDVAKAIYRKQYWDPLNLDRLPQVVRFDLFDAAVNSGVKQAVKLLQRAAGVKDDGIIGPMTLAAANAMDPQMLDKRLSGHRLRFMASLRVWPSFARGWANRIAANLIED